MNYPTFYFDRDKCQEYATGLKEVGEQLKYFKYLFIEYEGKSKVIPRRRSTPLRFAAWRFVLERLI